MAVSAETSPRKSRSSSYRGNALLSLPIRFVSETELYHHGEQSLNQTIVAMAQDFVGANNLNLLQPNGQFGTRLLGGKDSASPRYIYTCLSPMTRLLLRVEDDALLTPQEEEGVSIEPVHFLPIIPLVLVNGAVGIGTGWSTHIPNHNPLDVANRLLSRLRGISAGDALQPWYRGFTGSFRAKGEGYVARGRIEWTGEKSVRICELPVGRWTQDYKEFLCEAMQTGKLVNRFTENHTDTEVSFTVTLREEDAAALRGDEEATMKAFKLTTAMRWEWEERFSAAPPTTISSTPRDIFSTIATQTPFSTRSSNTGFLSTRSDAKPF